MTFFITAATQSDNITILINYGDGSNIWLNNLIDSSQSFSHQYSNTRFYNLTASAYSVSLNLTIPSLVYKVFSSKIF